MHQARELLAQQGISPGSTAGKFSARVLSGWVRCPDCSGEVVELKNGVCWDCDIVRTAKNERIKSLVQVLGSEKAAAEFSFDRFKPQDGVQAAFIACSKFNPARENLYLWGPCGTGKTHLANAAARELYLQGETALVLKPAQLMRRFRKKDAREEEAGIKVLSTLKVFVLDDLGVEKTTEYALSMLYEILEDRINSYRNGLIITSNLSLDQLAQKLGDDRIPSRLNGICRQIEMRGQDYRAAQRAKGLEA